MVRIIYCYECKNFYGKIKGMDKVSCKAFPDGIPLEIIEGKSHKKPYPGDNGIQFEKKE